MLRAEPEAAAVRQHQSAEAYYRSIIGESRQQWAAPASFEAEEAALQELARAERQCTDTTTSAHNQEASAVARADPEQEVDVEVGSGGIGYRLLRKAGWKGTGGLGAREQGISAPLQAWIQGSRQGIGALQKATRLAKKDADNQDAPKSLELDQSTDNQKPGQKAGFDEAKREQARRSRAPKREWQTVRVEEPLDKKVRRLQQVLQVEADEKAAKEIERYVFRAFRDDTGLDTNPLLRKNNLSASNPLA